MNVIDSLEWRYAVKKFDTEKKISQNKIEILEKAFSLTATSYGLQPIKMLVIENKDVQEQLLEPCFNQQQISTASHVLVLCIEDDIDEQFILNYFERVKDLRNTPDEILNPFKDFLIKDFEKSSKEKIETWAKNQLYLTMGNLLTVCAIEKIDACPMEGFDAKTYDEILGLTEKGLSASVIATIGYRSEEDDTQHYAKVRKSKENLFINI